jgi:hypothetical protein
MVALLSVMCCISVSCARVLNGRQESSWRPTVERFGQDDDAPHQVALFPEDHAPVLCDGEALPVVRIKLAEVLLQRPRQWGASS